MYFERKFLTFLFVGFFYPVAVHASEILVSGTVTDKNHQPLQNIQVELFNADGTKLSSVGTNANGQWSDTVSEPGTYFARTAIDSSDQVEHEVWNNIPCNECDPKVFGTPIEVGNADLYGISFHLEASKNAPIFSSSFEFASWEPRLARIKLAGRELFFNGINLAWISFANDIGPDPATPDLLRFEQIFQQLQAAGGNVMRLWLHTTGSTTPEWDGLTVSGPGTNTISDLQAILDLANQYDIRMMLCLWSFDMMRKSRGTTFTDRSREILTQQYARQSYIDNALTPMVSALKGHPAILAWEIFNEPEGMSNELGWDINYHVPMSDIQAFVNQSAGAIHRADPDVFVTNGAAGFLSSTDVGVGNYNFYSDQRLIDAGSDVDGVLDFYTVHYYGWAGTAGSPFYNPASTWQLDKPLVIAEFFSDCDSCGPDPHQTLYDNGYAGALGWSWTDRDSETLWAPVISLSNRHPEDIIINPEGRPIVALNFPQDGTVLPFGEQVILQAESSDPDGNIEYVAFYRGALKVGQVNTAPYELAIKVETLGETSFYALAKDNEGRFVRTPRNIVNVAFSAEPGRLEAEDANFSSLIEGVDPAASGGAYIDMQSSGSLTWTVPNVPADGEYYMIIGYNLIYDTPKTQLMSINGGGPSQVVFGGAKNVWQQNIIKVNLVAGTNTIEFTAYWGWMYFDYIAFMFL